MECDICHQSYPKEFLGMYRCYCSICSKCANNNLAYCPICDEQYISSNATNGMNLPLDNIKWLSRKEYTDLITKVSSLLWNPPPVKHSIHIITAFTNLYKSEILAWNNRISRFILKSKLMIYNLITSRGLEHQYQNVIQRMERFYAQQSIKRKELYEVKGNTIVVNLPSVTHVDAEDTTLIIDKYTITSDGKVTDLTKEPLQHTCSVTDKGLLVKYGDITIKNNNKVYGQTAFFPGIPYSHLLHLFEDSFIINYFKQQKEELNIFHTPFNVKLDGIKKSVKRDTLICVTSTHIVLIDTVFGGIRRCQHSQTAINGITDACLIKNILFLAVENTKLVIISLE